MGSQTFGTDVRSELRLAEFHAPKVHPQHYPGDIPSAHQHRKELAHQ